MRKREFISDDDDARPQVPHSSCLLEAFTGWLPNRNQTNQYCQHSAGGEIEIIRRGSHAIIISTQFPLTRYET
jgi:hypothetical protein